ncbi:unnamed protein product, partial [marine sediment metagenome]
MAKKPTIKECRRKYNDKVKMILPQRCALNGGKCALRTNKSKRSELVKKQPFAFIMRPYSSDCLDMELACKNNIKIGYFVARNASEERDDEIAPDEIAKLVAKDIGFIGHGYCQICSLCLYSYFGVAELGHLNPNVMIEVGLMHAFGKPVILTLDTRLTQLNEVPFDINGVLLTMYQNS